MPKWLRSIISDLVVNLLFWGLPLVVSFLAWLQLVPWYIIAWSVIFAFGAIFRGYNQFDVFRERRGKGFASQSDEQIEAILQGWLLKRGYTICEDSQVNTHFQFVGTNQ